MRVVCKIGTSSLTDHAGRIRAEVVTSLCGQLAGLRSHAHEVVLVSSGAVSAGVAALGFSTRPSDMPTLQAVAAAGQSRLMETYNRALEAHGLIAAQVLLVPHDFVDRHQYLHARQTLTRLLELGCVPIVNENDAIASDEIRYGDNDRIAALVAHSLKADLLVLLTDTPGLYNADPRYVPDATLLASVEAGDDLAAVIASTAGTARGSGGMASKLSAARMASWSGVPAVIASAQRADVLADAVAGVAVGTRFEPSGRRLGARKLWIAFATRVGGAVVIDDGARRALLERGTSLLPAGVTDVDGQFLDGEVVEVHDARGATVARGLVALDAATVRAVRGKRTADLPDHIAHEVIHRDDLVMLV